MYRGEGELEADDLLADFRRFFLSLFRLLGIIRQNLNVFIISYSTFMFIGISLHLTSDFKVSKILLVGKEYIRISDLQSEDVLKKVSSLSEGEVEVDELREIQFSEKNSKVELIIFKKSKEAGERILSTYSNHIDNALKGIEIAKLEGDLDFLRKYNYPKKSITLGDSKDSLFQESFQNKLLDLSMREDRLRRNVTEFVRVSHSPFDKPLATKRISMPILLLWVMTSLIFSCFISFLRECLDGYRKSKE